MNEIDDQLSVRSGPSSGRGMPVEVLCLGPPRTGAKLMKSALEQLGYNDTYYYLSSVTDRPQDTHTWLDAFNAVFDGHGTFGKEEFDRMFENCQAVAGRPCCAFGPQLVQAYPEAKVILNTRDVDEWFNSYLRLIKSRKVAEVRNSELEKNDPQKVAVDLMRDKILGVYFKGDFVKNAKIAFNEHFDSICQLVPRDKLLIFNVKEGWEPLCNFLGKPVPDGPFPGHDSLETFNEGPNSVANRKPEKSNMFNDPPKAPMISPLETTVTT
ncbi:hypothetical protein FQN50_003738 [Emmonsiellopsis sp. PD_5]|nr:hypothetical protein FQN50_003738 [Emmonsiellopsis sp. PD_5]